ncbi:phosphonate C-P lyase system protein PhnG [Acinetobacter pittii]|uniref:phosphonate C-P lyase system protein PhnG n=1 Tax=Acinetobacter pittii TaxID=48296 RepID=UPI0021CD1AAA|nr:phosphonate C-P lyase system protein PhnG [Acinetobacter pittii]MCU4335454.1 phosphonate C-P lyase system protein PhnG [Acinetobacter pittii]
MIKIPQKDWIRALTAHPSKDLITLAESLTQAASISLLQLPQAGLGLITLQESAFYDAFYLGEFPVSSCHVELHYAGNISGAGSAQVMADDAELAKALAILDAILAHQLPGWQDAYAYVELGQAQREKLEQQRKSILTKTRVDFATLDATER